MELLSGDLRNEFSSLGFGFGAGEWSARQGGGVLSLLAALICLEALRGLTQLREEPVFSLLHVPGGFGIAHQSCDTLEGGEIEAGA
jgi:hypothetical protein